MPNLTRTPKGTWTRDDTALKLAIVATLDLVRRSLVAYELFPDLAADERRDLCDHIYADISALSAGLQEIDTRKGGEH